MKTYTVQCGHAAYQANTVVVEAATLEEALDKAIAEANANDGWKAIDYRSPAFVDAVAEGSGIDPGDRNGSSLPIPRRFTEQGEPPTVTVTLYRGLVGDVHVEGGRVRVLVKDYETKSADPDSADIHEDQGGSYTLTDWTV